MNRLTGKLVNENFNDYFIESFEMIDEETYKAIDKLGQLEDLEEELGVDLIKFLTECNYVLKNSSMTTGKMTNGKEIRTDFGYVEDFIRGIKEELEND